MLWNWYTVDACFLSSQWHVRSAGAFAGSVIAVFIITALVEGVRRAAREYDRQIVIQAQQRLRATEAATRLTSDAGSGKGTDSLKFVASIVSDANWRTDSKHSQAYPCSPDDPTATCSRRILWHSIHGRLPAHVDRHVLQWLHAHGAPTTVEVWGSY